MKRILAGRRGDALYAAWRAFHTSGSTVVLRRLGERDADGGFVRPDMPDYDLYYVQLTSVVPDFGNLVFPSLDLTDHAGSGRPESRDPERPRRGLRANKEARSPAS